MTRSPRSAIKRNIRVEDIICRLCRVQATRQEDRICEVCKAIGKTADKSLDERGFLDEVRLGGVCARRFIFGLGA